MTLPSPEERAVRKLRIIAATAPEPITSTALDAADLIEALDAALTAANQDAALGWEWAEQFVDPGLVTDEGWNEWLEDLAAHRHAVARRARLSDGADDD